MVYSPAVTLDAMSPVNTYPSAVDAVSSTVALKIDGPLHVSLLKNAMPLSDGRYSLLPLSVKVFDSPIFPLRVWYE
jgi:hypothetical protein